MNVEFKLLTIFSFIESKKLASIFMEIVENFPTVPKTEISAKTTVFAFKSGVNQNIILPFES